MSACCVLLAVAGAGRGADFSDLSLDEFETKKKGVRMEYTFHAKDFYYFGRHSFSVIDDLKELRLQVKATYPIGENVVVGNVEAAEQASTSWNEGDFALKELYFELNSTMILPPFLVSDYTLRVGQQMFSWGSGIMFNPTDNLSVWNAVDPFDAHRRGVPAVKLSFSGNVQILDLIAAAFEPSELPGLDRRFFIRSPLQIPNPYYPSAGPPMLQLDYTGVREHEYEPDGTQLAVRYTTSLRGWDVALSFLHGYENIAVFEPDVVRMDPAAGRAEMIVNYIYPRENVWGWDVSGYVGKMGLHLEGAYFDMKDSGHNVGMGDDDYVSVIGGVDYPFYDVIGTHDVTAFLEYAREIDRNKDDRIYINRVYKNSLLLRLVYTVGYELSFEGRFVYNFDTDGSYSRLQMKYQYSDNTSVKAGVETFHGDPDCFMGVYDENDRFFVFFEFKK